MFLVRGGGRSPLFISLILFSTCPVARVLFVFLREHESFLLILLIVGLMVLSISMILQYQKPCLDCCIRSFFCRLRRPVFDT